MPRLTNLIGTISIGRSVMSNTTPRDKLSSALLLALFHALVLWASPTVALVSFTVNSTLYSPKIFSSCAQSSTIANWRPKQPRPPSENGIKDPALGRRNLFSPSSLSRCSQYPGLNEETGWGAFTPEGILRFGPVFGMTVRGASAYEDQCVCR